MLFVLTFMLWHAYRKKFSSISSWLLFFSGSALVFTFIFFAGTWAFLSMHLRWLFLALYVAGVAISFINHRKMPFNSKLPKSVWFTVSRVFVLLIGAFLVYMYIDSRQYSGQAVSLDFPFKNGTFYMMQGGSNRLSNLFHSTFSKHGYGYAMDIAELNTFGNRAKGIYSDKLTDYEIYNDTIYSPGEGKIIKLVDGVHDNAPGTLNTKQVHGNHIVIQNKNYVIFMAHLKKGSYLVKQGQVVKRGQPLALLGNAGFTVEPHLHLNIIEDYDTLTARGKSIPALFNGRFYTLNDIIRN